MSCWRWEMSDVKISDWTSCYDEGWGNDISALSYSHPAKVARGLIKRIYSHMLDQGWLQPGDVVVDPFAGIGGTALDAITNGLNYIGCELEQKFVDLGAGCDCTGISKADWIRFCGRWDRANHKDGHHWCPACLAQAKAAVDESPEQFSLFGPAYSATYKRNSGRIPFTLPHRYQGNLDLFHRRREAKGWAVMVQGDSRRLASVISAAAGVVSSPPYAGDSGKSDRTGHQRAERRAEEKGFRQGLGCFKTSEAYGNSPGQLGAMLEGQPVVVGSPPYANDTINSRNGIDPAKIGRHGKNSQALKMAGYGEASGQLSNLPAGDPAAVVSSPPWAGNSGGRGEASRNGIDPALFDRHQGGMVGGIGGPGNLAGLEPGEVGDVIGGVVSSPPFEKGSEGVMRADKFKDPAAFARAQMNKGHGCSFEAKLRAMEADNNRATYGDSPGQLGTDSGETFWAAAKTIVSQCALILPPGRCAVWIVKGFVRSGEIVDFPGQWQALCEACGFETIEIVRAWLVKDKGTQIGLNGEAVKKTVERKSFFRRIAERNGAPRIDYEIVLFTRRINDRAT